MPRGDDGTPDTGVIRMSLYCKDMHVTHEVSGESTASEVVEEFLRFMLGCGFAKQNVVDAMVEVAEEHDDREAVLLQEQRHEDDRR